MRFVPTHRIATHPGALLREQIEETGMTVDGVARDSGAPPALLREIVEERRGVTAETAEALAAVFGQTAAFWTNAQTAYDLSRERMDNRAAAAAAPARGG